MSLSLSTSEREPERCLILQNCLQAKNIPHAFQADVDYCNTVIVVLPPKIVDERYENFSIFVNGLL